jgi:hypothetical protein
MQLLSLRSCASAKQIIAIFVIAPTVLNFPFAAAAQDWAQLRTKVKNSILYIEAVQQNRDGTNKTRSSSTGFVIAKNGYGLTVAHAVPRGTTDTQVQYFVSVGSRYANKFPVEVVKRDEELDIALLQFPDVQEWVPVEMGESKEVPESARLCVLGFPRLSDLSAAEGLLSNHFGPGGKWQTTLPLDYGNSGGPVFDIGGRVIGVAAGGLDDARAITFVIPSNYTKPFQQLAEVASHWKFASEDFRFLPWNTDDKGEVKKAFAFSFTASDEEKKNIEQEFCLPDKIKIVGFEPTVTSQAGKDTKVVSFLHVPDKPNCVRISGTVSGDGVDKVGSIVVNYRGRGALTGYVDLTGVQ